MSKDTTSLLGKIAVSAMLGGFALLKDQAVLDITVKRHLFLLIYLLLAYPVIVYLVTMLSDHIHSIDANQKFEYALCLALQTILIAPLTKMFDYIRSDYKIIETYALGTIISIFLMLIINIVYPKLKSAFKKADNKKIHYSLIAGIMLTGTILLFAGFNQTNVILIRFEIGIYLVMLALMLSIKEKGVKK